MSARAVQLEGLCDEAEAAWPEFRIPRHIFLAKLRTVAPSDGTVAFDWTQLCHVDLYLAVACSIGESAAITVFSRRYMSRLSHYLRRFGDSSELIDDVRANLEDKLLFSAEVGHPPRIHQYVGRGPLEAWVAMTAQRSLLSMLRSRGSASRSAPADELWELWSAASGLERDESHRFADTIRETLRQVIQSLPVRERNVLRLSIVEDVSLSQIARMLNVNQSTVSRAFHACLDKVNEEMRVRLKALHGMRDSEIESVVRDLRSQIDLSLSGVFADAPELAASLRGIGAPLE